MSSKLEILYSTILILIKKFLDWIDDIFSLKSGDEIVTLGGLYGKIVEVKAETFVLEIAGNTKVKISRAAISHKVQQ